MTKAMYVRFEVSKELADKVYQIVEGARDTGKIKKGTNEVTKVVERGEAKFVVMAEDITPPEILAHLPLLCEEKKIPYAYAPAKEELGRACGLEKPTASVAVMDAGRGKQIMDDVIGQIGALKK